MTTTANSSEQLGQSLSDTFSMLVTVWQADGPDAVHGLLQNMSADERLALLMALIGATAAAT